MICPVCWCALIHGLLIARGRAASREERLLVLACTDAAHQCTDAAHQCTLSCSVGALGASREHWCSTRVGDHALNMVTVCCCCCVDQWSVYRTRRGSHPSWESSNAVPPRWDCLCHGAEEMLCCKGRRMAAALPLQHRSIHFLLITHGWGIGRAAVRESMHWESSSVGWGAQRLPLSCGNELLCSRGRSTAAEQLLLRRFAKANHIGGLHWECAASVDTLC
jgi:hypothetical protein